MHAEKFPRQYETKPHFAAVLPACKSRLLEKELIMAQQPRRLLINPAPVVANGYRYLIMLNRGADLDLSIDIRIFALDSKFRKIRSSISLSAFTVSFSSTSSEI